MLRGGRLKGAEFIHKNKQSDSLIHKQTYMQTDNFIYQYKWCICCSASVMLVIFGFSRWIICDEYKRDCLVLKSPVNTHSLTYLLFLLFQILHILSLLDWHWFHFCSRIASCVYKFWKLSVSHLCLYYSWNHAFKNQISTLQNQAKDKQVLFRGLFLLHVFYVLIVAGRPDSNSVCGMIKHIVNTNTS